MLETPKDPVRWPVYIFYFKPIVVLLNVIPFGLMLILYRPGARPPRGQRMGLAFLPGRRGFRHVSLAVHADAEQSHGRGLQCLLRALPALLDLGSRRSLGLAIRGGGVLRGVRRGERAAGSLVPRVVVRPAARFVSPARRSAISCRQPWFRSWRSWCAQYAVFGEFKLAYEAFGTDEYLFEGSLWKTPLELDAFNEHPEPYATYFFHMTLGHHGFFSLTPIFLLSAVGAVRLLGAGGWRPLARRGGSVMPAVAWLTIVLTAILLAFYTWNPKARNYGGSTQGLRWLFWLIPFWLLALAQRGRMGSNSPLVSRRGPAGAGRLGDVGRLRDS